MGFSNTNAGGLILVRPALRSPNYVAGSAGWTINADGTAEFANATVRGDLLVPGTDSSYVWITTAGGVPFILLQPQANGNVWQAGEIASTALPGSPPTLQIQTPTNTTLPNGIAQIFMHGQRVNTDRTDMSLTATDIIIGDPITTETGVLQLAYTELQTFTQTGTSTMYVLSQRIFISGAGTTNILKANYPNARAFLVRGQASGGGSGGAASAAAGNASISGCAGGGAYGEVWILASAMAASEALTIGAAGTAGAAGNNAGGAGGALTFGTSATFLSLNGGGAGGGGASSAAAGIGGTGGAGGSVVTADWGVNGGDGSNGWRIAGNIAGQGFGGDSHWAGVKRPSASGGGAGGLTGYNYGGGAACAFDIGSSTNRPGAAGGIGAALIEVYM